MDKSIWTKEEVGSYESPRIRKAKKINSDAVQWSRSGKFFTSIGETIESLPCGYYSLSFNGRLDTWGLSLKKVLTEKLLKLPYKIFDDIINDINSFWGNKEQYDKYEFIYKRGILLYGPPGCGKTSIIQLLSETLINEHEGIIISIDNFETLRGFVEIMPAFKDIEGDRKIILIIEDIDNFVVEGHEGVTLLLNVLDGSSKMDNIVTIATTNYPERLQERISNRPSRFDRRYEINKPDSKVRKYYIENVLKDGDLKEMDIETVVKDTEDFTIDHIKELILSVYVLGHDYNQSLDEIKYMMKNGTIKPSILKPKKEIGFGNQSSG